MSTQDVVIRNHDIPFSDFIILDRSNPRRKLDSHEIPDSVSIMIKNNPSNPPGFIVYIDFKPVTATSWPLLPGDWVSYLLKNSDSLYVGFIGALPAGVTQILVNITFEQDLKKA